MEITFRFNSDNTVTALSGADASRSDSVAPSDATNDAASANQKSDIGEGDPGSSEPAGQVDTASMMATLTQLLNSLVSLLKGLMGGDQAGAAGSDDAQGGTGADNGGNTGKPQPQGSGSTSSQKGSTQGRPDASGSPHDANDTSGSGRTAPQSGKVETYEVNGLGENKQKIVAAARAAGATGEETARCLAVANLETEHMDVNYQHGDGKSGGAANYSLYKMNADQIHSIDPNADLESLNKDPAKATQLMIDGMRKYGPDKFIDFHRGGASGLNGTMDEAKMAPYRQGIAHLMNAYESDKSLMTDDRRVKTDVFAI